MATSTSPRSRPTTTSSPTRSRRWTRSSPAPNLTYADRIEAFARKGYVLIELKRYDEADRSRSMPRSPSGGRRQHIDDPYYIAMASYYRGELAHRKFLEAPVRLPDDQEVADLEAKRVLAVQAYDRWKESLGFKQAYWATASGYQMSQIFVELWEATVKAPYPQAHRYRDAARSTSPRSTTASASTSRRRSRAIG